GDARASFGERDRPLRGTATELEHVLSADIAQYVQLQLGNPIRAPRQRRVREEVAVGLLVAGGVGIPERAVGTNRGAHAVGAKPASVIGSWCSTRRPLDWMDTSWPSA